jgi:hypothetical protein
MGKMGIVDNAYYLKFADICSNYDNSVTIQQD